MYLTFKSQLSEDETEELHFDRVKFGILIVQMSGDS